MRALHSQPLAAKSQSLSLYFYGNMTPLCKYTHKFWVLYSIYSKYKNSHKLGKKKGDSAQPPKKKKMQQTLLWPDFWVTAIKGQKGGEQERNDRELDDMCD